MKRNGDKAQNWLGHGQVAHGEPAAPKQSTSGWVQAKQPPLRAVGRAFS